MPVPDIGTVNEIVDKLLRQGDFITTTHCTKGDQHWDQESGPTDTIKAIITGFVYLGEVLSDGLDIVMEHLCRRPGK